uniref:Uncharacterized protein n=1 Tax=Rhizophora mucronata TaxID=61149 RepID=A0A2P2P778_RHIMU
MVCEVNVDIIIWGYDHSSYAEVCVMLPSHISIDGSITGRRCYDIGFVDIYAH